MAITTTAVPVASGELVTIRLTDDQARRVRTILTWDLPDEPLDNEIPREKIVALIAKFSTVLERLDRLGWDDVGGDRSYTDTRGELVQIANRLIDCADGAVSLMWVEDQIGQASERIREIQPALTGLAILEQLGVPAAAPKDTGADA